MGEVNVQCEKDQIVPMPIIRGVFDNTLRRIKQIKYKQMRDEINRILLVVK